MYIFFYTFIYIQHSILVAIKGWRRRCYLLPCYAGLGDPLKDDQTPYNKL